MVNEAIIKIAKRYINQVSPNLKLKKAYLFGSYAKGLEKEDSDIDIALVVGNMTDFFSTQRQLMKLRRSVDLRIEPHPIEESEFTELHPLVNEILKNGVEIN